jgi:hypothetical protein
MEWWGIGKERQKERMRERERGGTCWYITMSITWVSKSPTPTYIAQVRLTDCLERAEKGSEWAAGWWGGWHVSFGIFTILSELQKITKDIHIGLAIISTRMVIAELQEDQEWRIVRRGQRTDLLWDTNALWDSSDNSNHAGEGEGHEGSVEISSAIDTDNRVVSEWSSTKI